MPVLTAILSFLSTNTDDLVVLMLLYAQAKRPRDRVSILLGQYLGIGAVVLVSLLISRGLAALPLTVTRLLGLVPILLGIRAALARDDDPDGPEALSLNILPVMLLAIADSGDNLGVYIPLFSSLTGAELALTLVVYAVLLPLWGGLAAGLAGLPPIAQKIDQWKRVLVPVVLIGIGLLILLGIA